MKNVQSLLSIYNFKVKLVDNLLNQLHSYSIYILANL